MNRLLINRRSRADRPSDTPSLKQIDERIRKGFVLKTGARQQIQDELRDVLAAEPDIDHALGYLPSEVWIETRGYIERVARQLNGCIAATYYDAASVMLRRLAETLIIEAYERLGRQHEIQGADGNYLMLRDLADRATSSGAATAGLNLGRDAKIALKKIKELGDKAAHNRRFTAVEADLGELRSGARTAIQELVAIAALK